MTTPVSRGLQAVKVPEAEPARQRRLLAAVVGVGVTAAVVAAAGAKLGDPHLLPVTTVRLVGTFRHIDTAKIQQVIRATAHGNLLNINVDQVRAAVQAMPWAAGVAVQRLWPDTLRVTVMEQNPLAQWGDKAMVNQSGEVFVPDVLPQGLPTFEGPEGSSAVVSHAYREMATVLVPLGLQIVGVGLDERRAWQVELDNGMRLMLGRKDRMRRLQRFVRAYPAALRAVAGNVERVDLRYTNGFAVRWKKDTHARAGLSAKTQKVA